MDKILLKNMMFYGYHGVHEYEREQGQRFYLDVTLGLDLTEAGNSDNLNHTIDYTAVYSQIKNIVENRRFMLLEALAACIAEQLLASHAMLDSVHIKVRKPAVPIPGQLDFVQVELERSRGQ